MNLKLCRPCLVLWLIGLAGMWVSRMLLHLELQALPFQVAAGAWILGGVGYTGFGLLSLVSGANDTPHGS